MIKKSFRAYNTRRHLEFAVLLDGEMVRVFFLQMLKEDIHRALDFLVVLPGFAGIDKVQEGDEIPFFLRGFVPDVADQGTVIQALRLDPEIFGTLFPFVE